MAATFVASAGIVFASTLMPATQTGCAGKAPPPSSQPPILLGASLGLTGGLAGTGAAQRDALLAAQGQINAAGGLLGRQVQFIVEDDASDEGDIVTRVANDLVSKGVVAVIGPVGSSQVLAVQQIYAQAHVIQISGSATSTKLADPATQPALPGDRWLFRTVAADDFQGAAVMLLAQRTPRGLGDAGAPMADGGPISTCSKLSVVYIMNAYGTAMDQTIHQYWKNRVGQDPVAEIGIPVDLAADYKAQVDQVYKAGPQCLAFIMYEDTGAEFIREFKADARFASLPNGFFFIGTDGVDDDVFVKNARSNPSDPTSDNVADNVNGTTPDSQPATPEFQDFSAIYASYNPAYTGKDAPPFASNAYDAAMLVALAIAKANTVDDRVAVRDALIAVANPPGKNYSPRQYLDAIQAIQQGSDIDYKGASGTVDIQKNGNVLSGFAVWQVVKNPDNTRTIKTVGRFELADLQAQLQ